ncbi:MAG: recombinase family protein [Halanaerobiales bacterium]
MREYGYIRVSSKNQNPERQIVAMKKAGIKEDHIFIDKLSGKDFNRPEYILLTKKILREGDTLYIKELDRLGRNADKIKDEWKVLTDKGVNIVVLDMPILDTRQYKNGMEKVITNIVLELLSYIAEQEREKIRKRQKEGIAAAKARGQQIGRPSLKMPDNFGEYYKKVYIDNKMTAVNAMEELGLKKTKFYDFKKEYEEDLEDKSKQEYYIGLTH